MTNEDLNKLEALADKATQGPWQPGFNDYDTVSGATFTECTLHVSDDDVYSFGDIINNEDNDVMYIASLDPQTVKELIALARKGMRNA